MAGRAALRGGVSVRPRHGLWRAPDARWERREDADMTGETIGIIGLGRMGSAMAKRLSGLGFRVSGWSRSGIRAEKAVSLGLTPMAEIGALAAASDIIISSLIDDEAVDAVMRALGRLPLSGKLIVETSTISPQTLRAHAAAISAAGAQLLDAPISGGPETLLEGRAGLYIGGSADDFERFRPIADHLSDRVHHIGPLGDGLSAKLVNNMMLIGLWQTMKEAITLGAKAGLPADRMIAVIAGSPAASPALKSRLPIITGESEAVGFPVSGAIKDARVVRDFADRLGIAIPATAASLASFERVAANGHADRDLATMVRVALVEAERDRADAADTE
ncbi:MAG: NAD(P)-dependent oxidoreductase [Neorhizobium sp.]|nr:NAD(P)-dependent oxidoreductase [Neorhizobium sp.]